ncbi:MAG: exonuclease domain-containing protein [Chthoniobacterales bacterium]
MQPEARSIRETRFAAIDFESAGAARGDTDTPIQIGIAVMEQGEISHTTFLRSYLQTDKPIVWSAQKVHGITSESLTDAPTLLSLWPDIRDRMKGNWIVAHSAGTEKRFLRTFPLHGFGPWLDTLHITRALFPDLKTYDLSSLANHFGLEERVRTLCPEQQWHDALFDSVAALVLLQHLCNEADLWESPCDLLTSPRLDSYYRNQAKKKFTQKAPDSF